MEHTLYIDTEIDASFVCLLYYLAKASEQKQEKTIMKHRKRFYMSL